MNKLTYLLELYAPAVLRIGMAIVILWFSLQQFIHNSAWVAYIPDSIVTMTHLSAPTLVLLNAVFELVFGLALMFGVYTRLSALLLALHLFDIMWVVGYGEIGVRDLGLAVGTFVIFMNGPDIFCLQNKKRDSQIDIRANNIEARKETHDFYSNQTNLASQGIRRV